MYQEYEQKIQGILSKEIKGFTPSYPCTKSWRTAAGSPLSAYIDHTLLKQQAPRLDYEKLCTEAMGWNVHSVCVPSNRVSLAKELLKGSSVTVCTVVGFPFGYANTPSKVMETQTAIKEGAGEIDMVIPVGLAKEGDWVAVYKDIAGVVAAAQGYLVKVILETSELSPQERILASLTACYAGAGYLKTSTGFASGGATVEDITMMRHIAGPLIGVKASGGVRTHEFAKELLALGVDRIGSSGTAAVLGLGADAAQGKGY